MLKIIIRMGLGNSSFDINPINRFYFYFFFLPDHVGWIRGEDVLIVKGSVLLPAYHLRSSSDSRAEKGGLNTMNTSNTSNTSNTPFGRDDREMAHRSGQTSGLLFPGKSMSLKQ